MCMYAPAIVVNILPSDPEGRMLSCRRAGTMAAQMEVGV